MPDCISNSSRTSKLPGSADKVGNVLVAMTIELSCLITFEGCMSIAAGRSAITPACETVADQKSGLCYVA